MSTPETFFFFFYPDRSDIAFTFHYGTTVVVVVVVVVEGGEKNGNQMSDSFIRSVQEREWIDFILNATPDTI